MNLSLATRNYPQIAVPGADGIHFIYPNDIMYALAEGRNTRLHLMEGKTLVIAKKLKEVIENLQGESFLRIHHSHFINLNHLVSFNPEQQNQVIMSNGIGLAVSRSRKQNFLNHFIRI